MILLLYNLVCVTVNTKIIQIMSKFGTLSPIIGTIMILISIQFSPDWSLRQSIFDLGFGGFGSVIFSSGLLMSGSLAMLFSAGLFEFTKKNLIGQSGSIGFLMYAVSTCVLGISIIDLGDIRSYAYLLLFLMIPISTLLLSYFLYRRGLKRYVLTGVFVIAFSLTPLILRGQVDAVKELTALIPFSIWQVLLGLYLINLE